jgi:transposase InsO family protein
MSLGDWDAAIGGCAIGEARIAGFEDRDVGGRARFFVERARSASLAERRAMVSDEAPVSIRRQCELLRVGRSGLYYEPVVERLWRSLKYEHVYLRAYDDLSEARDSIGGYFEFYNHRRRHQALGYSTPEMFYRVPGQAA